MNLPNRITVFRIFLVPLLVFIWLFPYEQFNINFMTLTFAGYQISLFNLIVLAIFIFACLTDFFDGQIARRRNLVTTFGKFADPIADKLLINTMLILLAHEHIIPVLLVVIMLGRDIIVNGCRMMAAGNGIVVAAGVLGKTKTVAQMLAICLHLLNNLPFELWHLPMAEILIWFATLVSVMSGYAYFAELKEYIFESK